MKFLTRLFAIMALASTLGACSAQPAQNQECKDTSKAVKIVAEFKVKPECVAQFAATAKELVLASQAEEGNITYTLNACAEDPETFTFIEIWKDLDAIEAHNASAHFQKFVPLLGDMCDGSVIKHYTEIKY